MAEPVDQLKRRATGRAAHRPRPPRAEPQCGFASTVAGNPITEDDMRAKLARVVEAARAIWG